MAAEVAGDPREQAATEAPRDAGPVAAAPPGPPRHEVRSGDCRVARGMDRSDAAYALVVDGRPVREAGRRGDRHHRHPDADETRGRRTRTPTAHEIEQAGGEPTPEWEVGQQRVERVAQPLAPQHRPKPARG